MTITYATLRDRLAASSAGIRATTSLQPMGGENDKIFPPTYGVADSAATKYASEERVVDGVVERSVVVDSVASQANRMELALLDAIETGLVDVPVPFVDFSNTAVGDVGRLTALEAPHRIFDAIFRDSLLDGELFRLTPVGRSITEASIANATALFRHAPTALLFGAWDSTGPKGGRGAKYERAITSEIAAIGVSYGTKTSSRLDPLAIEAKAGPIYQAADPEKGWTLDPSEAAQDKGKPLQVKGGDGADGRPSQVNHGNIAPSVDTRAGGVTAKAINSTMVLSFAQLRRLRFPFNSAGEALTGTARAEAEAAARCALAAIGLAAHALATAGGYDLRSRCVLVPTTASQFELIGRSLDEVSNFDLDADAACELVQEAASGARAAGLAWDGEPLALVPSPKLVELMLISRATPAPAEGSD